MAAAMIDAKVAQMSQAAEAQGREALGAAAKEEGAQVTASGLVTESARAHSYYSSKEVQKTW